MRRHTLLSCPQEWRESAPTRWYVVFCDVSKRQWWDRVFRTRDGFSHVYALRWDGWNWLLFNPHTGFTDVAIIPGTSQNALHSLVEPEATVVEVEAFRKITQIRGRWWVGPMTCVEQIKALLGLPVGRLWTPWQLYRYLMEECADGQFIQKADRTRSNSAGARGRAPPTARARRINQRGKRAPESG